MPKDIDLLNFPNYFDLFSQDDTIRSIIQGTPTQIFPAIQEQNIEGDCELIAYPNYKDALTIMQRKDFNPYLIPHTDLLVHYTNQFLKGIGIYEEDIVEELEPFYANEDLIAIQTEIDEEKLKIEPDPQIKGIEILYRLDDTRLKVLNKAKFYFVKKYFGKLRGLWNTKILERKEIRAPIRVFTIHTPKVKGSECEYAETQTDTEINNYGITVFGIGSNLHKLIKVKNQNSYIAKDGRCYEIIKYATIVVERRVEMYKNRRQCEPYTEAYLKEVDKGYKKFPLKEEECASLCSTGEYHERYDLSKAIDPDKCSLQIMQSETRKFQIDLGIPFSSKINMSAENESYKTKELSYILPGGHNYRLYKPKDCFGYVWDIS